MLVTFKSEKKAVAIERGEYIHIGDEYMDDDTLVTGATITSNQVLSFQSKPKGKESHLLPISTEASFTAATMTRLSGKSMPLPVENSQPFALNHDIQDVEAYP